jgi:hypothetical protein
VREIVKDMKLVDEITVSPFSNFDNSQPARSSSRQGFSSVPSQPPKQVFDAFDDDNKAELDASV